MDLILLWYTILLQVSGLSVIPAGQTQSRVKRGALNVMTLGTLEKQALVDAYNLHRAAVSPTATNMIKMVSSIMFIVRGDIKILNCWLQPKYCSIQQQCIAFPI